MPAVTCANWRMSLRYLEGRHQGVKAVETSHAVPSPITPKSAEPVHYAALGLRFRALRIDLGYCLGLFVIGGLVAGILLENSVGGRIAVFVVILAAILGYEPFMVARYGGTFGHQKSNIRIVCARSNDNLPFWRAAVRSVVKEIFGIPVFVFMFVTSRAQGLHDLLAGARVIIRDPLIAAEVDHFKPAQGPTGRPASRVRRIVVTLIYNVLLLVFLAIVAGTLVSSACINRDVCSASESLALSILGGGWLVLGGFSIVLGWTGRLPGIRPRDRH
ncbi:MAG: RDD family protein [Bryobacteraceae bacterium]